MRLNSVLFWSIVVGMSSSVFVGAQKAPMDAATLIKKVDELYRSHTSEAQMEMHIETPNWKRTLRMRMWTRGMTETFITIDSPKKDRGISTLRKDKEMWNYFPKINKIIKVPPSMMMGSWMGSDFTNDDLVKETSLLNDYTAKLIPDNSNLYVVELIPKENTATVWGKIVVKFEKKNLLPVEECYFDEKGEKIRALTFKDVRKLGGKLLPAVMEMITLNKKDRKTVFRYQKARFNHKINSSVFTLRNLRKRH